MSSVLFLLCGVVLCNFRGLCLAGKIKHNGKLHAEYIVCFVMPSYIKIVKIRESSKITGVISSVEERKVVKTRWIRHIK